MSFFRTLAARRAARREARRKCAVMLGMLAELHEMAERGLLR